MGGFKIYYKNNEQKPNLRFDLKNPLTPAQNDKKSNLCAFVSGAENLLALASAGIQAQKPLAR